MKADSVRVPKVLPQVPSFNSLTEANKWLQGERGKIADINAKYDAGIEAMKKQAKSTGTSLQDALKESTLSQQQRSNLQVLAATMKDIEEQDHPTVKLSGEILKPEDLKADGFQGVIGYIIDGVIVFVILMLALQKSSEKKIEEIKDQEMTSLIEAALSEAGILYDAEILSTISLKKQYELFKIICGSEELIKYLKTKAGFADFANFASQYPQLARSLGGSPWLLNDIKKELITNASFGSIAEQAIKLTPAEWQTVKSVTSNPEDIFHLEEETRTKFLKLLKQIQIKASFKQDQLKEFLGQFMLQENMNTDYLMTLEECVSNVKNAGLLLKLNGNFVATATPRVARFICKIIDRENQFSRITSSWSEQLNDSMVGMINNAIVDEPQFETFMSYVFNSGGIDGAKKMLKAYTDKKLAVESNSIGNKILQLRPDLEAIKKALSENDDQAFLNCMEKAFVISNASF